jgi:hypothetical protein
MNQKQRDYLIKKIKDEAELRMKTLKASIPSEPDYEKYLHKALMSDNYKIKSIKDIKNSIDRRLEKGKKVFGIWDRWDDKSDSNQSKGHIRIPVEEFLEIGGNYHEDYAAWQEEENKITTQIMQMQQAIDTLEHRLMLASDKVLEGIIREVDDMGNLQLIDTKIKMLQLD